MTDDGNWRTTFRPDIPSAARIYDYLLGGKDNYPADRAVAESMIAQLPNVQLAVQWNRAFLPLRRHEARVGPGTHRARPGLAARVAAGPR